jgi:hypothetical protein
MCRRFILREIGFYGRDAATAESLAAHRMTTFMVP